LWKMIPAPAFAEQPLQLALLQCLHGQLYKNIYCILTMCHLGGVVVSVLATGPKGCGFEPGHGDRFLQAIKICSTPSPQMGSKAGTSHVVRFYGM
jgi:hypothetical protein